MLTSAYTEAQNGYLCPLQIKQTLFERHEWSRLLTVLLMPTMQNLYDHCEFQHSQFCVHSLSLSTPLLIFLHRFDSVLDLLAGGRTEPVSPCLAWQELYVG